MMRNDAERGQGMIANPLTSSRSTWRWGMTAAALAVSARCDEFQSRSMGDLRGIGIPSAAGAISLRITRTYRTAPIVARKSRICASLHTFPPALPSKRGVVFFPLERNSSTSYDPRPLHRSIKIHADPVARSPESLSVRVKVKDVASRKAVRFGPTLLQPSGWQK